jgi:DNA-binding NarL/FixJ family response regulator
MASVPLASPTALVLDGDDASRQAIVSGLSVLGYDQIWEATSLSSALAYCAKPRIDLAVIDLRFAEDAGYNIISLLMSLAGVVGKIVAIADDADRAVVDVTLRRGAQVVLSKPLEWEAFGEAAGLEERWLTLGDTLSAGKQRAIRA